MPFLGILVILSLPHLRSKLVFTFVFFGFWILVFFVVTLVKHWEFRRLLTRYLKLDKVIRGEASGTPRVNLYLRLVEIFGWSMNSEKKRFFQQGYKEEKLEGLLDHQRKKLRRA
jgi:hypothetical protein